ncbi:U6 snRNA-associated Sm-like protein LSm7 [Intoshia linei]|uniref:U6 snRNA-associated Sm-like protein LSm7 n=1 Tax=Intoshia linei TaxID=1819745 RepID=A0A177B0F6_9BILA|nr:U6 snRNA-associated Sm-like protein LSm7 [Intoshia linei]
MSTKQRLKDGHSQKKRQNILDVSKFINKEIRVKFIGGREVSGILKGHDNHFNIVLDSGTEHLRDPDDAFKLSDDVRVLGLVVCRGTTITLVCPVDGSEAIQNPFMKD